MSLSTAYAIGDVFSAAPLAAPSGDGRQGFLCRLLRLIAVAAALVLIARSPLGLLTEAVQTLAGVLLPSATVFLLLLCNDKAVLGPWVNIALAQSVHRRGDRRAGRAFGRFSPPPCCSPTRRTSRASSAMLTAAASPP